MNAVMKLEATTLTHLASREHSVEKAGEQGVVLCHELRHHRVARRPMQTKAITTMVKPNKVVKGMLHMGSKARTMKLFSMG